MWNRNRYRNRKLELESAQELSAQVSSAQVSAQVSALVSLSVQVSLSVSLSAQESLSAQVSSAQVWWEWAWVLALAPIEYSSDKAHQGLNSQFPSRAKHRHYQSPTLSHLFQQ